MYNIIYKAALKERCEKKINTLCKVIIITFNFIALGMVFQVLENMSVLKKSNFHMDNLIYATNNSALFLREKLDFVINMIYISSVVIIFCVAVLLIIINKTWINSSITSSKVYRYLGYDKINLFRIIMINTFIEYFLGAIISFAALPITWKLFTGNSIIKSMFESIPKWKIYDIKIIIYIILIVFSVTLFQTIIVMKTKK